MGETNDKRQKITVFQQRKRAEAKVKWIKHYGKKFFDLKLITITSNLPKIIENSSEYLPKIIDSDLVLDYLEHPDLSNDLAELCIEKSIPIISSGKKTSLGEKHYIPPVCCGLAQSSELGKYSKYLGKPKMNITVNKNTIGEIEVLRGSPCGSTWKAAEKIIGLPIEIAARQFGLNIQYFCTANPASWDPISGKSPVHTAAKIHKSALAEAIKIHLSYR